MGEQPRPPEEEQQKTDWSRSESVLRQIREEKRAKMSPEELAKDDKNREMAESVRRYFDNKKKLKTGTPEEKKQAQEELDTERNETRRYANEAVLKMEEQTKKDVEIIKQQTYDQIKKQKQQYRQKYGIKASADELKSEDEELRRKLGIE